MASLTSVFTVSSPHPSRLVSNANDTSPDVFASGAVITVICAFLSIFSCALFAFTWCPIKQTAISFRIQSWALFLCAAWLFATLVIYDYFFATRSAQITINVHGQHVPETVIQRLAHLLDFTHAYRDAYFCAFSFSFAACGRM